MSMLITSVLIILAMLVGFASAEGFDDFVNDLYSDLAPLLALFGERVTMQFISQALGIADCVALAMAPLGVITIMVSAIRVGGPTWLKALVGRAKENKAAAELELMSSTSREVCELYNGENIVRCLGSGSAVWQYICLFPKGTDSGETGRENVEIEFMTPDEVVRGGFLALKDATGTVKQGIWRTLRRNVLPASLVSLPQEVCPELALGQTTEPHRSKVIVIHDDHPEAPNMSLNLQGNRTRTSIRFVASFGVFLQVGILVFFTFMVFHPTFRLKFTKDDKPVPDIAFPLAFVGTVVLVLGMLLCAHVVEKGTKEKSYQVDDKFEMRLYWLQNKQTLNDQMFESFSIAQGKACSTFSMSRREEKYRHKRWHKNWQQIKAVAGVIAGVTGFIWQFVGLRNMNSYASLSQLVAVALMTFCRAVVFPGFTTSFEPAKLVTDFELDWLAQKLGIDARLISHRGAKKEENAGSEHRILVLWSILHDRKEGYRALVPLTYEMGQAPASEAQHVLVMRRGLCRLAKVLTTSSICAGKLADAMRKALGILFPDGPGVGGAQGFRWIIDVSMGGVTQQAWIDLYFAEGVWKVPAGDLEAAISLWSYTIEAEKEKQRTSKQRKDAENIEDEGDSRDGHESSTKEPEPTLDSVNRNKEHVIHDLNVWACRDRNSPMVSSALHGGRPMTSAPSTRATGCDDSGPEIPEGDLLDLCATRLLFSFMWSMAKAPRGRIMGPIKTETVRWRNLGGPRERSFDMPLWNEALGQLLTSFTKVSCFPEMTTIREIVSPLSVTGKLPFPRPWFDSMSSVIKNGYLSGNLEFFSQCIIDTLYLARTYGNGPSGIGQRCVAWLLELHHGFTRVLNRYGQTGAERPSELKNLRKHLQVELEDTVKLCMGPDFLGHMSELYARQGREIDSAFRRATRCGLPAHLEVTSLHRRAMGRSMNIGIPAGQRPLLNAQDVSDWTPLHWAAAHANVRFAKCLLEQGADATMEDLGGFTAAHYACKSGCLKMVKLLAEKVEMDTQALDGTFPMHLAAEMGNHSIVRILLQKCNRIILPRGARRIAFDSACSMPRDFDGRLPVHYGAAGGHAEIVRLLKGDINAQDNSGWTPLHLAALAGQKNVIRTLYDLSANGEVKDHRGRTPLILACSEGKWETTEELINAGAEVNESDSDGMTVFHHLAAQGASSALISTIVKSLDGKDTPRLVNLQDSRGQTPLHLAARAGNPDTVIGLIKEGADADATDDLGRTPLPCGI